MSKKRVRVTEPVEDEDDRNNNRSSSSNGGNTGLNGKVDRRAVFQKIAFSRASHFARAQAEDKSAKSNAQAKAGIYQSQASSTPTGNLVRRNTGNNSNDNDEAESWPGPWSTARSIIAKRNQVQASKKNADDSGNQSTTNDKPEEEFDKYDHILSSLANLAPLQPFYSQPIISCDKQVTSNEIQDSVKIERSLIPTLTDLCVEFLVNYVDEIEDLNYLPQAIKDKFAIATAKLRKFTPENAMKFASTANNHQLYLPDCSLLDEHHVIELIEKIAGVSTSSEIEKAEEEELEETTKGKNTKKNSKNAKKDKEIENPIEPTTKRRRTKKQEEKDIVDIEEDLLHAEQNSNLQIVNLRHCGRAFSDRTAIILSKYASHLEELIITGCFKLSDAALSQLLNACQETLLIADVSYSNRITVEALSFMGKNCHALRVLRLNHCNHLTHGDITQAFVRTNENQDINEESNENGKELITSSITPPIFSNLCELSLVGLTSLTDLTIIQLLSNYGSQLTALDISDCSQLTDESLIAIRAHCCSLKKLGLAHLDLVSTAALLALFLENDFSNDEQTTPINSNSNLVSIPNNTLTESKNDALTNENPQGNQEKNDDKFTASIGDLEEISFDGTVAVTDEVIIQLCENNLKNRKYSEYDASSHGIRVLSVNGCHQLTNRSLIAISMYLKLSLLTFDCSFVRQFTESILDYTLQECTSLQTLYVFGCTQLTNVFFQNQRERSVKVIGQIRL